ncbi:hypothetical protein A0H81_07079 [Grifola frondosa]|uniref:Uncharacterized protein n=1 Tax=Grifola frondosa TaxID=5627 RepID=A0A1C7M8I8_GRIFR|nr:hypothetical protein A0H81_07079 [Grifola frondosa]
MSPLNMTRPPFFNDDNASEPANKTSMPANFVDDGWAYASYMAQPPAPFTAQMPSVPAGSMRDSRFGNLPANYSQTDPAIGSFIGRGVSTTPTGYSASDTFVHGSMNMPEIGTDTYGVPQLTTPGITTYPGVVKGGILSQTTYAASRSTVRSDPHSTPYAGVTGSAMETLTETYDMSHSPAFAGGTPVSTYVDARDVSQPVADSYLAPSTTSYTGEKDVFERGTHASTYTDVHRVPQRVAHPVYHTTPPVGPAGGHTNSHANTHDVPRPPACAEPRTTSYPGALDGGSAARLTCTRVGDICQPPAHSMLYTTPSVGPAGSDSVPMYVHEYSGFQPRGYLEPFPDVFNGSCTPISTYANVHDAPQPVAYPTHHITPPVGPSRGHSSPCANTHSVPQTATNPLHGGLSPVGSRDGAKGSKEESNAIASLTISKKRSIRAAEVAAHIVDANRRCSPQIFLVML